MKEPITDAKSNVSLETNGYGRSPRDDVLLLINAVRCASFWIAIALPFVYLPLLYNGIRSDSGSVFLGLLGLNVFALLVGHGYELD